MKSWPRTQRGCAARSPSWAWRERTLPAHRIAAHAGGAAFLARNDALQHLGNVGFREPIPAYKHSAALFLQITGGLASDAIHP
jgi:hypothetical protein